MGAFGSSERASASTGDPDPDHKVLAKVTDDTGAPTLVITKEPGQTIAVGDLVYWNGVRSVVTARGATDITIAAATDCVNDVPPTGTKWVYAANACNDGSLASV